MSHNAGNGLGMSLGYANVARNLLLGRGFVLSNEPFWEKINADQQKTRKLLDVEDYLPDIAIPGYIFETRSQPDDGLFRFISNDISNIWSTTIYISTSDTGDSGFFKCLYDFLYCWDYF